MCAAGTIQVNQRQPDYLLRPLPATYTVWTQGQNQNGGKNAIDLLLTIATNLMNVHICQLHT